MLGVYLKCSSCGFILGPVLWGIKKTGDVPDGVLVPVYNPKTGQIVSHEFGPDVLDDAKASPHTWVLQYLPAITALYGEGSRVLLATEFDDSVKYECPRCHQIECSITPAFMTRN